MDQMIARRIGHDTAIPVHAALHRESRPGRRLLLQLRLRVHGHDQLGESEPAAPDDPESARGVRPPVRRRHQQRRPRRASSGEREHPRLDHGECHGPETRAWRDRSTARGPATFRTCASSSSASSASKRGTQAVKRARLPEAPPGVPDSFDEHMKLMFDVQVLAFESDMTRVFSFKTGRDASSRCVSPRAAPTRASIRPRTTADARRTSSTSTRSIATT